MPRSDRGLRQQATSPARASDTIPSDALEFGVTSREVPVPELPSQIIVPGEGPERMLGHAIARSIIAKRLERAVGPAVQSSLDSYSAVLRRWALDEVNDVRTTWAATVDAVRAEIDRQLGHAEQRSTDVAEIRRDLERFASQRTTG